MFYIATSFTLPGHRHYNNLYKTTAANLFTQSKWITVNQPSWPAGKPVESFFSISGEYLYLLQYYSSEYYWQLSKWDFASTWTAIESNHDGTPAPRQDAIPSIAANDGLIVVAESYRTPSPQWRIRTSADGVTWKTAYSLDLLSTTGSRENVCDTYVLGKLFMIWVTSCESTNGYALISDQSGNFRKLMGVTSHYVESSIGDVMTDGTTIVTGGQNPYSNTQLNLFKKAAP